jgi:transposase
MLIFTPKIGSPARARPGLAVGDVMAWVTVFVVRVSRGSKVGHELLGERFRGYLATDRWSAYTWYPTWRRQVCWAYLLRDIEAMIERGRPSQVIGEALRAQARQMFHS